MCSGGGLLTCTSGRRVCFCLLWTPLPNGPDISSAEIAVTEWSSEITQGKQARAGPGGDSMSYTTVQECVH